MYSLFLLPGTDNNNHVKVHQNCIEIETGLGVYLILEYYHDYDNLNMNEI